MSVLHFDLLFLQLFRWLKPRHHHSVMRTRDAINPEEGLQWPCGKIDDWASLCFLVDIRLVDLVNAVVWLLRVDFNTECLQLFQIEQHFFDGSTQDISTIMWGVNRNKASLRRNRYQRQRRRFQRRTNNAAVCITHISHLYCWISFFPHLLFQSSRITFQTA